MAKYLYYPVVFIQESEEADKVIDMLEEGDKGMENALRYLQQWEEWNEAPEEVPPYGTGDRTEWIDKDNGCSYVISYRYGLYVSLTRVQAVMEKAE